jgi:hypothetical protein
VPRAQAVARRSWSEASRSAGCVSPHSIGEAFVTNSRGMPRFLVLYRSPMSPRDMMANASPEEMQAGMDAWMGWARNAGPAVVDLGAPLDGVRHLGAHPTSGTNNNVSATPSWKPTRPTPQGDIGTPPAPKR